MPSLKILLVEDEAISALYTQKCLTILGYDPPVMVTSGPEAIQQVEQTAPDLVLMDVMLAGEMDGIEAAQQIYERFQTPVIYLTAYQDEAILSRAIVTKPYGYLLKPFNLSELRVTVETALNKHQQEKAEKERIDQLTRLNRRLELEIAERERVEEALRDSEGRWRSLVENAGSYIVIVDRQGVVQFINHTGEDPIIAGMMGRSIYDVLAPDYHPAARTAIAAVFETGDPDIFMASTTVSGYPIRWFENRLGPIKKGDSVVAVTIIASDITPRKLAEEKVLQLNEELEQRVIQRTAQLQEVQEQLVRQEKLATLGQLASGVSHELRNPLGVLNNASYFLKIVLAGADETVQEYLNIISTEVRKSEKIVSDLLSFSRQRAAICELVSLSTLVETELAAIGPPPAGIVIVNEVSSQLPPVQVDPQQIGQVLTNLITNACQAMTTGGTLTITAAAEGDGLTLSVGDTGPGIPPENLPKIFEPLFTTKARGIGLGLAVSKQLVEANHGEIRVCNRPGQGCEFIIRLPVSRTEE